MIDDDENSAKQLRYKCRRHNADYYTDSAIPDTNSSTIGSDKCSPLFSMRKWHILTNLGIRDYTTF
jgi:hypothetical protein